MEISRRHFIRQAACAAVGTTSIASTVWNLRAINAATAQAISSGGEFRALVCLFLYGGNDANNMVVPNDDGAYGGLRRGPWPLALAQTSLLPLNLITADPQGRTFALHPGMPELQALFNSERSPRPDGERRHSGRTDNRRSLSQSHRQTSAPAFFPCRSAGRMANRLAGCGPIDRLGWASGRSADFVQ